MAHALLLSPDDQAVSAITGVLEEMSVTCERPLDGVSAAQKLNSQSFDLVLVDCENLPAAKLIFDVCRRGKGGNNPVPIAIVDGRAGLPTAFRLGAELILTKPVSKDQARTTIRTAVSRVRKEAPAEQVAASVSLQTADTLETNDEEGSSSLGAAMTGTGIPLDFAIATDNSAAAAAQLTSFSEPVPGIAAAASMTASAGVAGASSAASRSAAAYVKEVKSEEKIPDHSRASVSAQPNAPAGAPMPALVMKPSDDPVLLELEQLEQTELETQRTKLGLAKSAKSSSEKSNSATVGAYSDHADTDPEPSQMRRNAMLIGTLMLALAGGGFYAVWNYQPGFKGMAQAEISRALSAMGISSRASRPAAPVNVANPAAVIVNKPAGDANAEAPTAAPSGTANPVVTAEAPAASAAPNPATLTVASAESANRIQTPATQPATKAAPDKAAENKVSGTTSEDSKLPASSQESGSVDALTKSNNALVLSSQGAQKRLIYSVQPKYSAEERTHGTQSSVVLKTFVKSDGNVADVRLVEGNPAIAPAAINAVKQWRYRPLQREGKAQPFQTVVIIDSPKQ